MSDKLIILVAMLLYMGMVIVIGLLYSRRNQNASQFFLGGRSLGPWVTAMSAEASDMSGWLLMGLPGVAYISGMGEAFWTATGLAVGTYLNWKIVATRLRKYSQVSGNAITIPDFFSNRFKDEKKIIMILSAFIILFFFTIYVATGFVACGKLFNSIFGLDYTLMMIISAAVILVYTAVGGFLAESTTDFIQGILMCISLTIVLIVGVVAAGGVGSIINTVNALPGFIDLTHIYSFSDNAAKPFGFIAIVSTMAWGLGYFGMPHVLLRFMAIRDPKELKKSRLVAVTWVAISLIAAVLIGLVGTALFTYYSPNGLITGNQETIFIQMAMKLMPPVLAGIMMSGIMAATMSTSDSQLLITASAISQNLFKGYIKKDASERTVMWVSRITIIIVTIVAAILALDQDSSIFRLVSYAWAGFGAAFGPLILFSLFWRRITLAGAVSGMVTGGVMVVLWKNVISKLSDYLNVYELLPAFIISCIVIVAVSLLTPPPSKEIQDEFEKVLAMD